MEENVLNVQDQVETATRKSWEAPRIVLERSLEVSAQGGPPGAPNGFIGPLSTSGGAGTCGNPQ